MHFRCKFPMQVSDSCDWQYFELAGIGSSLDYGSTASNSVLQNLKLYGNYGRSSNRYGRSSGYEGRQYGGYHGSGYGGNQYGSGYDGGYGGNRYGSGYDGGYGSQYNNGMGMNNRPPTLLNSIRTLASFKVDQAMEGQSYNQRLQSGGAIGVRVIFTLICVIIGVLVKQPIFFFAALVGIVLTAFSVKGVIQPLDDSAAERGEGIRGRVEGNLGERMAMQQERQEYKRMRQDQRFQDKMAKEYQKAQLNAVKRSAKRAEKQQSYPAEEEGYLEGDDEIEVSSSRQRKKTIINSNHMARKKSKQVEPELESKTEYFESEYSGNEDFEDQEREFENEYVMETDAEYEVSGYSENSDDEEAFIEQQMPEHVSVSKSVVSTGKHLFNRIGRTKQLGESEDSVSSSLDLVSSQEEASHYTMQDHVSSEPPPSCPKIAFGIHRIPNKPPLVSGDQVDLSASLSDLEEEPFVAFEDDDFFSSSSEESFGSAEDNHFSDWDFEDDTLSVAEDDSFGDTLSAAEYDPLDDCGLEEDYNGVLASTSSAFLQAAQDSTEQVESYANYDPHKLAQEQLDSMQCLVENHTAHTANAFGEFL